MKILLQGFVFAFNRSKSSFEARLTEIFETKYKDELINRGPTIIIVEPLISITFE